MVAILIFPVISPAIIFRDDLIIAVLQSALIYFFLLLLFLLPTSYVYWRYRIDVKVLGPEPAAAEPGDDIDLTVAVGIPQNASLKGALLEAFIGNLNIATQKLEASPTHLRVTIPALSPGYHKITVKVTKEGYFQSSNAYELLIAPGSPNTN
ncbi:MAG: hypothetical protein ACFFD8_02140 [Candidatus Thorarchaeota archaeon]